MAKLQVEQFVEVVKRSGLIDDARLNQALSTIDQSVRDSGIVAASLTQAGLITEWQSEKLLQGRHKGFYLGKYKLLNHIGTGGMGAVYLAEHRVMRHRVAIKLLPNHLASQKSYIERFHQEARASAQLSHPNMVRAFDVDHEDSYHFLVMEYVEGVDLQGIVSRSGPLDYQTAADYTRQAASGLAYAHRVGLIHRDIKPANLLVDKTGTVKILDMGLARFSDDSQGSLTKEYDQKMIGTVDYLAPEQAIDSHKVDARADIYSLGCTLYFMLSGDAPFPTGTIPQRLLQHQTGEPADLHTSRPDVPERLLEIRRKMMAKSPADRYQSADEVAQAITDFLGDGAYTASGPASGSSYANGDATSGPSLNEDLTLAPLEDEQQGRSRAKTSTTESSITDAKSSGVTSGSGVRSSEGSGAQKGESSSIHKSDSGVKSRKPKSSVVSGGSKPPKPPKTDDLMEELLTQPVLPPPEPVRSGPTPVVRRPAHHDDNKLRMMIVVGVGVSGALLIAGFLLLAPRLLKLLF